MKKEKEGQIFSKKIILVNLGDMKGKNNPRFGIKVPEEQKKRQSEKMKGRHWYNNGEITISAFDCPDGFVKGRLNGGRK